MKEVGILTHFYNTKNYGGMLQAYALCRALDEMGIENEQIAYDFFPDTEYTPKDFLKKMFEKIRNREFFRTICVEMLNRVWRDKALKKRYRRFTRFQNAYVSHSVREYDDENIQESLKDYEAFITGSDQVWNLDWYKPALFLDFVPSTKKKIAYAASIGKKELDGSQLKIFEKSLKDFSAISVRECDAVEMLKSVSPGTLEWTLDPTLLLDAEQWDEVSTGRIIKEKYIFCYFLGDGRRERKLAEQYAKRKKCTLVTIPHTVAVNVHDFSFGDKVAYGAGPSEFISLIKHAEFVFTDSFHACVFSCLYQKQFFAFSRRGGEGMSGRISSLVSIFGCEEHFCCEKERMNLKYLVTLGTIDYAGSMEEYEIMKKNSLDFLKSNLK